MGILALFKILFYFSSFLYPLKDYNMNLQPTLLCKITIAYSYTILLETIPRGAKDYDYPEAN